MMPQIIDSYWKTPVKLAVGLHLAVLLCCIFLPKIIQTRPKYQQIYTLDLMNVASISAHPSTKQQGKPSQIKSQKKVVKSKATPVKKESHPAKPKPVAATPKPVTPKAVKVPSKKEVAVPEKKEITPPVKETVKEVSKEVKKDISPAKPVSIKPIQHKKKAEVKKKDIVQQDNKAETKRLEDIYRKKQQEAEVLQRQAQEEADRAAQVAVDQLKQMIKEQSEMQQAMDSEKQQEADQEATGSQNTSNSISSIVAQQYYAAIAGKLQQYWQLPNTKEWSPTLVATVVIHIDSNGTVTEAEFEKGSGDMLFDKFVQQAILDASPFPPIPGAMHKTKLEVGLHFKPDTIQY